ncbi:hypothetical protein JCM5296_005484 [Sporobolomyces johnsonii]
MGALKGCSKGMGDATGRRDPHSCAACEMGKATRKPVAPRALDPPSRRLQLVAADTWGPAPVGGLKGERYSVVLVDGHSRYTWGDTVTSKGVIAMFAVDQMRRMERESGERIASFQSDNGTEFVNQTVSSFLRSTGIQHRRTVPYVHGQNGLVERRWRSLFETTRTLLADSRLPLSFWPYAFRSAVYLYNCSPTTALKNSTPYQAYYGSPPDLYNLRAWGCVAYLHRSPEGPKGPHKLAPRAVKARFIGYPADQRGWLFWIPDQHKVVTAWSALFREEEFDGGERSREEDVGFDEWMEGMLERAEEADSRVLRQRREEEEDGQGGHGEQQPATEDRDGESEGGQEERDKSQGGQEEQEQEPAPARQEEHEEPPTPAVAPPSRSPPDPLPPADPPRHSGRLLNQPPSHYVPLTGAPSPPQIDAALSLSTFSNDGSRPSPTPHAFLAFAVLDHHLQQDLTTSSLRIDVDDTEKPKLLAASVERALAVGPAWSGSLDQPTYAQAMTRPDVEKWVDAMMAELAAFEATGTWEGELVELPAGRRAIPLKWVLVIKWDAEGRVVKYKARLVARGDMQVDGVDYDEPHSSTVHLTTVRLILALLAAHPDWNYRQFDISNAYLLGVLDKEIYVRQPPGFVDAARSSAVRRLKKVLYGLKQGGREWQRVLRGALEQVGFERCAADHGPYVRRRNGQIIIVPTHVDDGMLVGDDDLDAVLDDLNPILEGKLKKVEPGLFLGMRIKRRPSGTIDVDQGHYTKNVLDRFFPNGLDVVATPLDSSYTSITPAAEDERHECAYRELLGALVYLSACTRPDIAFALSFASRFASCPAKRHWSLLVRICRYLAGTSHLGLRYTTPTSPFSSELVTAWSDADHAADRETRRSVSGYVFGVSDDSLRSTAISWLARRQKSASISSTEAEYVALSEAEREAIWIRMLLRSVASPLTRPPTPALNISTFTITSLATSSTTERSLSSGCRRRKWSRTYLRRGCLRRNTSSSRHGRVSATSAAREGVMMRDMGREDVAETEKMRGKTGGTWT